MPKEALRIDLLGTSFIIKADEDPAYLSELARRYARILDDARATTGLQDPLKLSIVAGLVLCDELDKAKRVVRKPEDEESERITLDLIARLDEVLKD